MTEMFDDILYNKNKSLVKSYMSRKGMYDE